MERDEQLKVIRAMQQYGGSFIKALAAAWLLADTTNCTRIEIAFDEYIVKYAQIAKGMQEETQ